MFHCLNPPLAGANGIEIRVDPLDRLVPALAITLAGYQEDKDQKCFHVPHVAAPYQWLLLPRQYRHGLPFALLSTAVLQLAIAAQLYTDLALIHAPCQQAQHD